MIDKMTRSQYYLYCVHHMQSGDRSDPLLLEDFVSCPIASEHHYTMSENGMCLINLRNSLHSFEMAV